MSTAGSGLLRGEESNGHVSVIETAPGPGAGPPLHHHDFDEGFYVLEGERFERHFAHMAAERRGVDPPEWALQPIPEVTRVGPAIDAEAVRR